MGMATTSFLFAIALFIVAAVAFGVTIKLLVWLLSGLVVGAVARLVLPGREQIGWMGTSLVGVAGGLLGGMVGRIVGAGGVLEFVLSVAAAAALLSALGYRVAHR